MGNQSVSRREPSFHGYGNIIVLVLAATPTNSKTRRSLESTVQKCALGHIRFCALILDFDEK